MIIGISTSVAQRGLTGVGQYILSLVRALAPYAGQHRFALFVLQDDVRLFDFVGTTMQLVPVPERFRPPIANILWHQITLPRLARRLELDVLHIPSYRRLLWPRPCALVATIHDLAAFRVAEKYDPLRMFYGRTVVRHLARRQHAIITVSQSTAQDVQEFLLIPSAQTTVVLNGLDHDRFSPGSRSEAKSIIAERHHVSGSLFLYVARLEHPAKNHVRLIEAFNAFKQETASSWKLVLGGSDWHGADVVHAAIRRSPFAKDIRCLGFVNEDELPTLYRAADVFVYPSLYEGFGLPPLEAMACGCPVISSTRGSLGEVVGTAAVTVDPENVETIRRRLVELAASERLRERLQAAGLAHARGFDWAKSAAQTMRVFTRALAQHRGEGRPSVLIQP